MKQPNLLPLVYSPHYSIPWDRKHRFPMAKYRLLHEHLHERGIAHHRNTFIASPCTTNQLHLAHDPSYVNAFTDNTLSVDQWRTLGFTWSAPLVRRALTAVGGSIDTARMALKQRMACHLAGGTHHAFRNEGRGFCIFNDLAVTALTLLEEDKLERVLILDCDVHQGDGTASILASEPRAFTVSLHGADNYPFQKQTSDLDVPLANGIGNADYLNILEETLRKLEQLFPNPNIILYDGGSDVHKDDRLGRLTLTDDGIRQRDLAVFRWAHSQKIPVACYIGGGYDHDHQRLVRRHALLIEAATEFFGHHYSGTS